MDLSKGARISEVCPGLESPRLEGDVLLFGNETLIRERSSTIQIPTAESSTLLLKQLLGMKGRPKRPCKDEDEEEVVVAEAKSDDESIAESESEEEDEDVSEKGNSDDDS